MCRSTRRVRDRPWPLPAELFLEELEELRLGSGGPPGLHRGGMTWCLLRPILKCKPSGIDEEFRNTWLPFFFVCLGVEVPIWGEFSSNDVVRVLLLEVLMVGDGG